MATLIDANLLCLCRPSDCRIPMSMVERKFILPDIELADGELEAYKYRRPYLAQARRNHYQVTHPSKAAIKANRDNWKNEFLDLDGFSDTLKGERRVALSDPYRCARYAAPQL